MAKDKPLVNKNYLLEKFPGKGGWTYAAIPEISQSGKIPFGWIRVKGKIDGYELKKYKLMPMGNNQLFLPVKAEIRKKINKKAGDYVRVILYADEPPAKLSIELLDCFKNEPPEIYKTYSSLSKDDQQAYLSWIYDAKNEEEKAVRIISMINKLSRGLKLYE